MASEVYIFSENFPQNLATALEKCGLKQKIKKGDKVAVKLHMGEYGNLNYVRPPIAGRIVELLKELGAKPFLVDSPTKYHFKRYKIEDYFETARKNGFTEETIGCPIVISDDSVKRKGKLLEVGVIKEIAEADAMVVLSHAKAHAFSGLGGAIKNLGMGAVNRKTKDAEHAKSQMLVDAEKCIGCAACVPGCPAEAIEIKDKKATIDYDGCWGCAKCFKACKQNALSPREALADHLLASCALEVLKCFENKPVLYVNVLLDIAANCDCHKELILSAMADIGFLVSENVLAIDAASIELINKQFGRDFFDSIGFRNPFQQIEWLEKEGYGTRDYRLETIR